MKLSQFKKGARLLVYDEPPALRFSHTSPAEITVVEVAGRAVRVKYRDGGEMWETADEVAKWDLVEQLDEVKP